jgi:hypothetical protein
MTVRFRTLTLGGLMALALATGCAAPGPQGATAPTPPHSAHLRLPPEALRDPVARFKVMDDLERQLIRKTQDVPAQEYPAVRARLFTQLQGLGLEPGDSERVLSNVDAARADRARVARWWRSLWSAT